ncbi:hypothetical protein Ga0100231_007790 [Opitutaceae bacterium TAV4]|nr:hypothetical protein Ga0100231_007790 [Opitutaceae bacterium TAV4]
MPNTSPKPHNTTASPPPPPPPDAATAMKHTHQFRHTEEQSSDAHARTSDTTQTFDTVENLLRHDARQTPLPPAIARRLHDSIKSQTHAAPATSWWRRIAGKITKH